VIGERLGPYEVTAKLGEGGMGEVWRARDTKLERDVAIKVLPAAFVEDHERLARFEREAKLLAQLNHPNIAHIYGMEASGESHALVMELVEGPTLAERMESGSLPLDESLSLARQIAEALEEAHEKGIIHRDLKPQNIKASIEGRVKVLDFGLAKAMDPMGAASGGGSASQLAQSPTLTLGATQMGVVLGTAAYMSPEQAKGFAVDKRADIWAFGVVLYEMLTGRRLFEGDSVPETLAGVLKNSIELGTLPEEIPAAIRRLLRRCLERNPKNRLHDIADARLVIDDLLAGRAEPPTPDAVAPAAKLSRATRLAVLGVLAVGVVAGFLAGRGTNAPAAKGAASSSALEVRKLTFRPGEEEFPALSPDGKSLFYDAVREGAQDLDVYFMPIGGRRAIDLTTDSSVDDWYPAVSPDGSTIAFRSERDGGGIYLMGTTGESPRRLTAGCFDPAWSPDGARIACTTAPASDPFDRGANGRLEIVDVATGGRTELATGDASAPAWSPDGRWIAYWGVPGDESGRRDLWNVAAAGGEPIRLTDDPPYDWNPVWSADGSKLYFLSNRGGGPNLWRLPIDRDRTRRRRAGERRAADRVRRIGRPGGRPLGLRLALDARDGRRDRARPGADGAARGHAASVRDDDAPPEPEHLARRHRDRLHDGLSAPGPLRRAARRRSAGPAHRRSGQRSLRDLGSGREPDSVHVESRRTLRAVGDPAGRQRARAVDAHGRRVAVEAFALAGSSPPRRHVRARDADLRRQRRAAVAGGRADPESRGGRRDGLSRSGLVARRRSPRRRSPGLRGQSTEPDRVLGPARTGTASLRSDRRRNRLGTGRP